jgi:hypothetical protein
VFIKKNPSPQGEGFRQSNQPEIRYFVPEMVVEWNPMMFPIIPVTEVQSAGVEFRLVMFTLEPAGTSALAAA